MEIRFYMFAAKQENNCLVVKIDPTKYFRGAMQQYLRAYNIIKNRDTNSLVHHFFSNKKVSSVNYLKYLPISYFLSYILSEYEQAQAQGVKQVFPIKYRIVFRRRVSYNFYFVAILSIKLKFERKYRFSVEICLVKLLFTKTSIFQCLLHENRNTSYNLLIIL